jgi:transposase
VEAWAQQRLHTLRGSAGQRVDPLDPSDDRLAGVLEALSDDERWQVFEGAFPQHLLRVDDLQPERVGLDSTMASGYWCVTEDELFQFGHSKDQRPDLPQVNVMLSVLDPLGLPVATDIVSGQRTDDPLYLPGISRIRARLGRRGLRYVGDGKMGVLETRPSRHVGEDFYLCPLSELQLPPRVLEDYLGSVVSGHPPLTCIMRLTATRTRQHLADGYDRLEPLTAEVAGRLVTWTERRLVVRSRQLARVRARALRARVVQAQAAREALNDRGRGNRRFTEQTALQAAAEAILTRHQVHGLLALQYSERGQKRLRRR